ncbi:hypothetical protein B0J14DRAFT_139432 [Halenospora varia]|nr:hypothetical protein B0J14DRAFT_139432 [Halenospora varia]
MHVGYHVLLSSAAGALFKRRDMRLCNPTYKCRTCSWFSKYAGLSWVAFKRICGIILLNSPCSRKALLIHNIVQETQTSFRLRVSMSSLLSLPYEVLAYIVSSIGFEDVFNLGLTCHALKFLIMEDSICKTIILSKIPFSAEAQLATSDGGHARALRKAAKRRNALATVSPYTVATIGVCDAYVYLNGVLCYTVDDKVRVLDLHKSGDHEIVISIPGLLEKALSNTQDISQGTFQVLYYSDRIISCLFQSTGYDSTAWLIAFNVGRRAILVIEELDSTEKIFVRHNKEFLYYGTHSEIDTDGHKKWVIRGYSFRKRRWFEEKIHLPEMAGSDIGLTNCFEFHNNYFYALSNQTSFEVEEIDWTSFYHCVRFPLDSPCKELMEKTAENKDMWRRQHQEGPLDERWMFMRLDVDETTGKLRIVESRKEWYHGSSKSQRTYYKTDVIFPELESIDFELHQEQSETTSGSHVPISSTANPVIESSSSNVGTSSTSHHELFDNSMLPNSQLLRLRRKDDHPHYIEPRMRLPEEVHPGDDGSTKPTFTLAKTCVRTYHTSSSAYIDLVDDPLPLDWTGTQRLRLRGASRRLGRILQDDAGLIRQHSDDLPTALEELYEKQDITFWPQAQNPDPNQRDKDVDEVYKLLNPDKHLGFVHGTSDDRSLVYATGPPGQPQALIFVGFDAAIQLRGVKRWGGNSSKGVWGKIVGRKGVGEGPHIDGRASGGFDHIDAGGGGNLNATTSPYVDAGEKIRTVSIDRKGKGKAEIFDTTLVTGLGSHTVVQIKDNQVTGAADIVGLQQMDEEDSCNTVRKSWAWREPAMYVTIDRGYNFGLRPWFNLQKS